MQGETQLATVSLKAMPDYPKLFSTKDSLRAQIMAATTRLTIMLKQPAQAAELAIWADRLQGFSPQQLTRAFIQAESTLQAWPAVSKIIEIIWEREFHVDLAWLMDNLRIHKPEWKDVPERKVSEYSESTRHWNYVIKPAIPSPEIPAHLQRALEIYGAGRVRDGLEALYRHPVCRAYQYDASEATRQQETIQRGFKSAYMQARSEI